MPRDRVDPPLHEPIVLQDIFVTRLAKIERVGAANRLVFAVEQNGYDRLTAVAKIVVQDTDLADIALQIAQVINSRRR